MDARLLAVFLVLFFVGQLVLCLRTRRIVLKLIPTALALLLTVVTFALYTIGNNWGWLIVSAINGVALAICGLAWLVYLIIRLCKR